MMRSLYSGVSGLKTHQRKMDVIGNNIANVNTVGFKASSVTFSDIMYQASSNASGASVETGRGGVNGMQTGLGVMQSATKISITSSGAAQTTGNAFDLMLNDMNSTNFFIVNTGEENLFTRDGSFYIDGSGNLCMASTGYNVMGWQAVEDTNGELYIKKDTVSALRVMAPENLTSDPEATTLATCSGILDKNSTDLTADGQVMNLIIYDRQGYAYTCRFAIKSFTDNNQVSADSGKYQVTLTDILDNKGNSILETTETDPNGNVTTKPVEQSTLDQIMGCRNFQIEFSLDNGKCIGIRTVDENGTVEGELGNFAININTEGIPNHGGRFGNEKDAHKIEIDFSGVRRADNGGTSTVGMDRGSVADGTTGAGKKLGTMTGVSVDQSGKIYGTYSNGNTLLLGQIAIAQFPNASGLEALGNNCFKTTLNSGDFDGIGLAVDADGGSMSTGALEMSNVDLSSEFTDMITTQRGFQANSRIITTSDTMLEELLNLKR